MLNLVPPEEPQIVDMDGNELKGLIGPYNEGDELKLICTTNGGNHYYDRFSSNSDSKSLRTLF